MLKKGYLTIILSVITALCLTLTAAAFTPIYGIDVSVWQGDISWGNVAETDKEFAIIRIGYNDKQDAQFEANYQNAKAEGVPVGCYMYSYAVTEQAAIEEAEIVLERIKGKTFEYPIYLDIEDGKLLKEEYNLTKEKRTDNALAFVRTMQEHGYMVGVYANLNWFTNYLDLERIQAECETWIAHYNQSYDYSNTAYGMWQYSDSGEVDGIEGPVDLNVCYKDYPSIIKQYGYNGFSASATLKGDINADKVCNLQDVVLLAQYVAGWKGLHYVDALLNTNSDPDGAVNLEDVVWLAQYVAGWDMGTTGNDVDVDVSDVLN